MSNEVAIPQNVAPSGRLSKQLWSVAITTPTRPIVKLILMGRGSTTPQTLSYSFYFPPFGQGNRKNREDLGPRPHAPYDQFEQNCKVTARTMMMASTKGTSLILRQKLSVPIGPPRCSILNRTARKW